MSAEARNTVYIGKKPLMAYVTSALIQLTSVPSVSIKARGLSISRAVDVAQIISRKTENAGYSIGNISIGSESLESQDGKARNVSTIEIEVKRNAVGMYEVEYKSEDGRKISIPLRKGTKSLKLSYTLMWKDEEDEKFRKSPEWKKIKDAIRKRDDYACRYCGYTNSSFKKILVNRIDGNPKNNKYENLEAICNMCIMIIHSGFWCEIEKVVECYAESKFNQSEIIQITRTLRESECSDEEIVKFLQLEKRVLWEEDLPYLSKLYGFITSRRAEPHEKPYPTEKEQQESLKKQRKLLKCFWHAPAIIFDIPQI